MTSEVVLMNSHSIAMAADSATTITDWSEGVAQERFFKGANKIFHISAREPVGVMIHNFSELQGMPWEVGLKSYRDQRGRQVQDTLQDYVNDLFGFIENAGCLITEKSQEEELLNNAQDCAVKILRDACRENYRNKHGLEAEQSGAGVPADFEKMLGEDCDAVAINSLIEKKIDALSGYKYLSGITEGVVRQQFKIYRRKLIAALEEDAFFEKHKGKLDKLDRHRLIRCSFFTLFKRKLTILPYTGLVFAGYGSKEFYPQSIGKRCFGMIFGKLICEDIDYASEKICHKNFSAAIPVAQSDMINTFLFGSSSPTLQKIGDLFGESLESLESLLTKNGYDKSEITPETMESIRREINGAFNEKVSNHFFQENAKKVKLAVGMLPVSELAELAETLILIESLNEKLTRSTESVSGPVDVAVVSKNDGFVWIKRKHYFDEQLNHRFFQRRTYIEREDHVRESA